MHSPDFSVGLLLLVHCSLYAFYFPQHQIVFYSLSICYIIFLFVQIARRLLGKIMIDLRNTREEAISVAAEPKSDQDEHSKPTNTEKEDKENHAKLHVKSDDRKSSMSDIPKLYTKNEDVRRSSTTSEISIDQDDDDDKETQYRLDPK